MVSRLPARALVASALAAACAAGGCARPGPPGGGPVDATPPAVVSTSPADGATGVPTGSVIEITFTEEMDRDATGRAIAFAPEVELGLLRWKGAAVTLRPAKDVADSTTFVVTVGPGAKDYHGIAVSAPHSFAFSTGPVLDSGVVAGVVELDGFPQAGAVVWIERDSPRPDTVGVFWRGLRRTVSGQDGAFRLTRVPTAARPYGIVAFVDADRDGRFDPSRESGAVLESSAFIGAAGDSAVGIGIALRPPRAGGGGAE